MEPGRPRAYSAKKARYTRGAAGLHPRPGMGWTGHRKLCALRSDRAAYHWTVGRTAPVTGCGPDGAQRPNSDESANSARVISWLFLLSDSRGAGRASRSHGAAYD